MKVKSTAPLLIAGINLAATLLVAATAFLAAPAFASGMGPAPWYDPSAGAPSSQRGPSALAEGAHGSSALPAINGYGGMPDNQVGSGTRALSADTKATFAHR